VIVACELGRTGAAKAFEKECGMYNAKRDSEGGGASHAIPSMGAIEGRITVLEVLAATSLRLLLKEGDKIAAKHALSSIRKAMRAKCNDVHLSADDSKSALAYVKELMRPWRAPNLLAPRACKIPCWSPDPSPRRLAWAVLRKDRSCPSRLYHLTWRPAVPLMAWLSPKFSSEDFAATSPQSEKRSWFH
jgi:hypothetical protein